MAFGDLILEVGSIGNWIQAVGLVVIIWIIVQGIVLFYNRRKWKLLKRFEKDLRRIEKKIDGLDKNRRK
ncbi:MAG: hypothetical protein Q8P57_01540 [Candidatus Pacearchaeota archaeon]|nr:hypothetical protein [Candidatus Pacearchaeota archaeon]